MKLKHDDIPIETGGLADQGEFRIKASATAFGILSSGLYSNKFKAILRELGCNAYDSHVEAGYPERPFTVHLPTRLNPVLSIRDYGVGLDHEQVMGLYTTYFESTKNDSNDFVGCMGLGSKSPFSYTKNFTIVAIKNGIKGTYSAFIGKNGVPNVAQLTSEETDEESGVEISFAVEEVYDMRNFKHEVNDTYKWFKTKPEITGDAVEIDDVEYVEENIAPGVHLREGNGYRAKSYALMGNVAYPINVPDGEELGKGVRELLHSNSFVIEVGIGELDIAASREELGYTDQTIDTLKAKAEIIFGALEGYVDTQLSPVKTKRDRLIAANKLISSNSSLFSEIVQKYVKKNSRKFPKGLDKNHYGINVQVPVSEFEKAVEGMRVTQKNVQRNHYNNNPTKLGAVKTDSALKPGKKAPQSYYQRNENDYHEVHTLLVDKTVIVFNDEPGNVLARIRAAVDDSDNTELDGYQNILIVKPQNQKCDKKAMLKFLKSRLPGAPIVLASKLPNVTGLSAGATGNVKITVQCFTNKPSRSYYRNSKEFTFSAHYGKANELTPTVEKGKKKTWVYLPLSHKTILGADDETYDATQLRDIIDNADIAKMAGIEMENVYGLNKTSIKAITEDKRWVNFFDFIQERFDAVDWKQARKEAMLKLVASEFNERDFKPTKKYEAEVEKLVNNDSIAGKVCKEWVKYSEIGKTLKSSGIQYDRVIIGMTRLFPKKDFGKSNAKLNVEKVTDKFNTLFEEFFATYPMLKHVSLDASYHYRDDQWTDAINYINLVDNAS